MSKVIFDNSEEPVVLSKPLFDLLLGQKNYPDLIALYSFYYYTAKWQRTNVPKATNGYVAKAIGWSEDKVSRIKGVLIDLGLIENTKHKEETTNRILGHYIKVKFLWTRNHPYFEKAIPEVFQGVDSNGTNAYNITSNIINTNNENALDLNFSNSNHSSNSASVLRARETHILPKQFNLFWELYPKKADKGKALTEWNKICQRKNGERPTWKIIRKAILEQINTERWQERDYIPLPSTWLHQSRWLDDPKEMVIYKFKNSNDSAKNANGIGFIGQTTIQYKEAKEV